MPLTPLFSRGNLPATPWNLNSTSSTSSCNPPCSLSPPPANCLPPPVAVHVHHLADHHQHWTLTFVIASFSHTNFIIFWLCWIYSSIHILRIFSQFWLRDYKNVYIFFWNMLSLQFQSSNATLSLNSDCLIFGKVCARSNFLPLSPCSLRTHRRLFRSLMKFHMTKSAFGVKESTLFLG